MRVAAVLAAGLVGAACSGPPAEPVPERVVVAPSGDVAAPPLKYTFPLAPGAVSYRLVVQDASGRRLAELEGPGSPLILAEPMARYFIRGEQHAWSVQALREDGTEAAPPVSARFVVR